MKKFYVLFVWLFSVIMIANAQSFVLDAEPGTCGGSCETPLNGNGTLGQIYNNQQCGLNFVQASNRIGQRFSPAGTGNPSTFSISGIPPCANNPGSILRAYLWAGTSGNGAPMTASITNPVGTTQSFPMTIVGSGPDKCWGYSGSYTYRADVTSLITGNGNYVINGFLLGGTNDVDGATLMIIYQDPQATYRGHIILHDGAVVINGGSTTQNVTGINACANSTYAVAFSSIADLQMAGTLTMNGTNAPFTWNWWNYTQVNTNITNGQANSAFTMNTSGDCFNFAMAGIYYQTTSCITCPSGPNPLVLTMSSTDASCAGNTGTATVTPSGVPAPYTYLWSNGANTQSISNLAAGTYTVTVSANGGCVTNTATVTIGTSGTPITLNSSQTNVSCFGGSNGSLTVTPSNGTGGYSYAWTPNLGSTGTITNLAAGSYTITVTDGIGCTASATYTITQPTAINISSSQINVLCNGGSTGTATVSASGGAGGYTYSWSSGAGNVTTATNLSAGNYTVTVTDNNGCTSTSLYTISQPALLQATISSAISPSCNSNNDGTITAQGTGGTGAYSYAWSNATSLNPATGLSAGIYTVTISDVNNCTATASATLINPTPINITVTSVSDVTCFGAADGACTTNTTGGTGGYTYVWSPGGNTSANPNNFGPGTYTVTVSDQTGCTSTTQTVINEPPQLIVNITSYADVSCYAYNDGSATAQISGGTGNYIINWSPSGGNSTTANQLTAGTYTIQVYDQNNCAASDQVIISQPGLFTVQASVSQPVICHGQSTDLDAIISGGIGTITSQWNGSLQGIQQTVSPSTTTLYVVVATDDNACVAMDTVTVVVNPLPQPSFSFNNACEADAVPFTNLSSISSGSITQYLWDFGDSSGFSTGTSPTYVYMQMGMYQVTLTATSDQGCQQTITLPVQIYDVPVVGFFANQLSGCQPLCVDFTNTTSVTGSNINTWNWTANGQGFSSSQQPNFCFPNPGSYSISLHAVSSQGCSASHTIQDYLTVYANPIADFMLSQTSIPSSDPYVELTDISMNAVSWQWNFGDGYTSILQNPNHTYADTGQYCIDLIVSSPNGCTDDIKRCLYIYPDFSIYIPNSFTPNEDKKNDIFYVHALGILTFEMQIFNRWGECIFSSDDIIAGWNGKIGSSDTDAEQGVYVYRIIVVDYKNDVYSYTGHVNLLR